MIAFAIVFCLIFAYMTNLFIPKRTYEQLTDYEKLGKNSLDVVFIGTSRIACSASPMIFWGKSGLKAYNLSTAAQGPQSEYYVSQDLLRNHKPKVVFMEANKIDEFYDVDEEQDYIKRATEQRPITKEKIEFILDIRSQGDEQSFKKYLLPLIDHHKGWYKLSNVDFMSYDSFFEKGQRMDWRVRDVTDAKAEAGKDNWENTSEKPYTDEVSLKYIKKTIELYQKNNVNVVIVNTPQCKDTTNISLAVDELVKEYNIKYLNLNSEDMLEKLDIQTDHDYSDEIHINMWGSKKISEYYADFLLKEFDLYGFETISEKDFEYWSNDYEKFYWHYNEAMAKTLTSPDSVESNYKEAIK